MVDTLDATKVDVVDGGAGPDSLRFARVHPATRLVLVSWNRSILRPSTNLVVRADVRLDTGTGVLTWRLSSIDPDTGVPPTDPLRRLPATQHHSATGRGSVQYTVMARSGVPTGGVIGNRASIVFDTNEAILTPVWTNAIDATAPVSTVDALPAVTNSTNIPVTWAGKRCRLGREGLHDPRVRGRRTRQRVVGPRVRDLGHVHRLAGSFLRVLQRRA